MPARNIIVVGSLSLVAGLLYNTWPLGYLLNPLVAKNSLASGLEAVNQPYNWLFITSDIVSSVFAIILCWVSWRRYKKSPVATPLLVSLLCIVIFGIGTIVDALLPEHCIPNLMRCASFTQDHILLIHGVFSITASVFLFIALCILWFYQRNNSFLSALIIGYVLFGTISLAEAIIPGDNGNWSQNYYITLCSIWLVSIPYALSRLANQTRLD